MNDPDAPPGLAGDQPPPLVGRAREQALLSRHLAAALAGRGGLVLLGGEAGIGKTALAEATAAEATDRGALVLVGRCYDLSETPPYGPWAEAFEQLPAEPDRSALPTPLGGGGRRAPGASPPICTTTPRATPSSRASCCARSPRRACCARPTAAGAWARWRTCACRRCCGRSSSGAWGGWGRRPSGCWRWWRCSAR